MTYGIQVFTDSKVLQIDDTYINSSLHSKMRVTLTVQRGALMYTGDIPADIVSGVVNIAVAPVDTTIDAYYGIIKTNTAYGVHAYLATGSAKSLEADIFFFTDMVSSANDYGLIVYDANGKVTFNSNLRYMRVLASIAPVMPDITIGLPNSGSVTYLATNVPNGRRLAICTSSIRKRVSVDVWAFPGDMDGNYYYDIYEFFGGYRLVDGIAHFRYWCVNSSGYATPSVAGYDYMVGFPHGLVLDVTGY